MEAKGITKHIPPLWGAKNRRKWKIDDWLR